MHTNDPPKPRQIFATILKIFLEILLYSDFFNLWLFFFFFLPFLLFCLSQILQTASCLLLRYIAQALSQLITFLLLITLKSLSTSVFTSPQSDIYMCLSDNACLELFCFLAVREPILFSSSL